jgi:NOL1/NOP2/fmu family ribosome biogenesis protein
LLNLKKRLEDYFSERFGVDSDFWKNYNVYLLGNSIWLTSYNLEPKYNNISCGLRALRIKDSELKGLKPTTYILQYLGNHIKNNVVDVDTKDLKKLFDGEYLENNCLENGYVALRYNGYIIGCGMKNSSGVKNQIPKKRAKQLDKIINENYQTEDR